MLAPEKLTCILSPLHACDVRYMYVYIAMCLVVHVHIAEFCV